MKIVLNKDETIEGTRVDPVSDNMFYKTDLPQDEIEYLIDKYVR